MLSGLNDPRGLTSDLLTLVVVVVGCAILAVLGGDYVRNALILFVINAILVTSYRAITSMGGWSFAHVAIMGVGAYSVAILSKPPFDLPILLTIVAGGVFAAVVAMLLAYPVLRTRQYYFFLSTYAAGEALRQTFIQLREVTGGTSGIALIGRPDALGAASTEGFLALTLIVFSLLAMVYIAFDASETGLKIRAIGEDEDLSAALGMNAWSLRALAFLLGSFGAGIAGGLLASLNGIVAPSDFGSSLMFLIVAACLVGGTGRFYGPILGLIFLSLIQEIFRGFPLYVPLIWGTLVICAALFARGGLEMLIQRKIPARRREAPLA